MTLEPLAHFMFNPGGITLAELSSAVKDLGIVGVLITVGWKGRSWVQPIVEFFKEAQKFFKRADSHMILMESNMSLLLNNHLRHLKADEDSAHHVPIAEPVHASGK